MDELLGSSSLRRVKSTPSALASFRGNRLGNFLRYFLFLQNLVLGLCDCSVNLPRRISDRVVIPVADAESLHVVWQNGDTIWSQKIDRDRCTNSGEAQVINRSESLAFPENGLSAAITAMQPGGRQLAVAWKDGQQLFLKLGDSSPATQSVVILDFFTPILTVVNLSCRVGMQSAKLNFFKSVTKGQCQCLCACAKVFV